MVNAPETARLQHNRREDFVSLEPHGWSSADVEVHEHLADSRYLVTSTATSHLPMRTNDGNASDEQLRHYNEMLATFFANQQLAQQAHRLQQERQRSQAELQQWPHQELHELSGSYRPEHFEPVWDSGLYETPSTEQRYGHPSLHSPYRQPVPPPQLYHAESTSAPFSNRNYAPSPYATSRSYAPGIQTYGRSMPHHRVYVLRCAHCNTFLSDRGMRAVLLLKPHITLFSTDASPVNSGALYSPNDLEPDAVGEKVERTCDCLTQSIGCYTCGNTIGYQIIAPCPRCTASISKHQRPANGHRFVFHHNEVLACERKYHEGEGGLRSDLIRHVPRSAQLQHRAADVEFPPSRQTIDLAAHHAVDGEIKDNLDRYSRLSGHWSSQYNQQARPAGNSLQTSCPNLKHGDTVYWHYLLSAGEMVRPIDPATRGIAPSVGR